MKTLKLTLFISILGIITSCSPRIVGVWNVDKFDASSGKDAISAKNIGTITFNKKGAGEKDLSFSILGSKKEDVAPFNWTLNDNVLVIAGQNSDFAKSWIVVSFKPKFIKLTSTDGATQIQTLELSK